MCGNSYTFAVLDDVPLFSTGYPQVYKEVVSGSWHTENGESRVRVIAGRVTEYGRVAGGKSGLHRAACRLTAGGIRSKWISRISATENIPPPDREVRR